MSLLGTHMLVVDDVEDNRILFGQMLKLAGVKVEVASDGDEAVTKVLGGQFDGILMDVCMPRVSGM